MNKKLLPAVIILAICLSACGLPIYLFPTQTPGPTETDDINVPLPGDNTATVDLKLGFGAGTLILNPGSEALVSGTATYNISDFKPTVTTNGSTISIEQGNWHVTNIPNITNIKNEWDLELGTVPMNLTIDGGAYHAEYEFGGLALKNLTVKDGAADVILDFSSVNPVEMSLLKYETGASSVSLTGLANANFASMDVNSGAGNYTLDFTGELQRAGSVTIQTGISNLTLVIPEDIPAQITVDSGLANVSHGSGWTQNGSIYTQEGSGPQLTFTIQIGAGNLTITH